MDLKRTQLQIFPKVAGTFKKKKKLGRLTKIEIYSIKFFMRMPRRPNGRSVLLL